jgi:xanthine/CO dehydrogenase XdhC/CoxF family maturation factor
MRPKNCAVRLDPGLEILSERLAQIETPSVLATVISAAGSTYRKPGARMLIEPDGRITGLLSGGCLEQDHREHASEILSSGFVRTRTYDMRADNDLIFGIGSGCAGCLGIVLERVEQAVMRWPSGKLSIDKRYIIIRIINSLRKIVANLPEDEESRARSGQGNPVGYPARVCSSSASAGSDGCAVI